MLSRSTCYVVTFSCLRVGPSLILGLFLLVGPSLFVGASLLVGPFLHFCAALRMVLIA
jgi:hypothetical protein